MKTEYNRKNLTDRSDPTDPSDKIIIPQRLRPSGGYRQLRSFRTATIIYDATVSFCERFFDKRSRTVDQMVQAARSGRQNIAEGSRAAATSSQTELRLVNVARASLDELLLDYEDFLRQRQLMLWHKDSTEAKQVRELGRQQCYDSTDRSDPIDPSDSFGPYAAWLTHENPAIVANAVICLIHQANYLLDKQIAGLEQEFISEGGYTERLAAARIAEREKRRIVPTDPTKTRFPDCPQCGKLMTLRTAKKGRNAGSQFWGCTDYPNCKGIRPLETGNYPTDWSDPTDPTDFRRKES